MRGLCTLLLLIVPQVVFAVDLDMRQGVTAMSQDIHWLHTVMLWVCIVIGVIVFGAMGYTIFAHRRSKHPEPANFHEHLGVEIVWTLIPVIILAVLAYPAAKMLIEIEDNSDAALTVLITGSQWKWHYQYLEHDIGFYSNMSTPREQINSCGGWFLTDTFCDLPDGDSEAGKAERDANEHYLLEVDNPLVLPSNRKVRFLTASNDVIHSWWVPDFAVKQDAIPGFINEAWTNVPETGTYRGQCTELCGKDHAFMPVVVEVRTEDEFDQWVEDQRIAKELASGQAVADREKTWTLAELVSIGEEVYLASCATCHQPNGAGQGSTYPALDGGEIAVGPMAAHIDRVMNGKAGTEMQAWAPQLSDRDIAAVITYERNAWSNQPDDNIVQPLTIFESR